MIFIWFRSNCLLGSCWMTKVSCTNLYQCLGDGGSVGGFPFKILHAKVCYYKAYQGPHRCSFNLFIELILKREVSIMQKEPSHSIVFCTDDTFLSCSVLSSSNNSFIFSRAGSVGMEVNDAEPS